MSTRLPAEPSHTSQGTTFRQRSPWLRRASLCDGGRAAATSRLARISLRGPARLESGPGDASLSRQSAHSDFRKNGCIGSSCPSATFPREPYKCRSHRELPSAHHEQHRVRLGRRSGTSVLDLTPLLDCLLQKNSAIGSKPSRSPRTRNQRRVPVS